MIQFNLLPDIKIQYLKAKRQEHAVVLGSVLAIIAAVTIFVLLMAVVHGLQKKTISDLNSDIQVASKELQGTKDLNKILTVQNQLGALTSLHDNKPISSRLYGYLSQVTPADASISQISVDLELSTITLNGAAPDLTVVNKYVDTLKFTTFTTASATEDTKAFSEVVLNSFARDPEDASYGISFKYDPLIFSGTEKDVTLTVPNIISTRSQVDRPTALFQEGN